MEASFLTVTLSFLILLLISSFTFLFSRRFNLPYTVILVIVGILLVPLSYTQTFSFIDHFKLTPDVLFYVFLPVLLFEASYKIDYRKMVKDWRAISLLAIVWICISALVIGWALYWIFGLLGLHIPFLVTLLFWVIISATDPVAVLAIFSSIWAPKRLALLFEWESLFNDWTAVALFLVVLWIIMWGWVIDTMTFLKWFTSFFSMMIWWALFWWLIWILFSKLVWSIKNAESVEIMLTMILAHITFLLAEFFTEFIHNSLHLEYLWVSWVVATVIAWIVMWNYGKYKITPKVEHTVEQMWEWFAFVSNSVVFILMWLYLSNIEWINISDFIIPTLVAVFVVIIARAISVYLPIWFLNKFNLWENIPLSWQHIMSWGSLRWALALMMVLMIPWKWEEWFDKILAFQQSVGWDFSYNIKDFILIIVIGCIMFTLLIKATTIPLLMKKTKVSKLNNFEKFEYYEWNILMLIKVIAKLDNMYSKWAIIKKEYQNLIKKYNNRLDKVIKEFKEFLKEHKWNREKIIRRAISLHSLWSEKKFLKEMFLWNEIWEKNFRYILRKIEKQIDRLSSWKEQLGKETNIDYDFFQQIALKAYKEKETPSEIFIRNRTKKIIIKRVLIELEELSKLNLWFDKVIFDDIRSFYEELYKKAKNKTNKVIDEYPTITLKLDMKLAEKSIFLLEESVIEQMHSKQIISDKLYIKFKWEIEEEFYSDVTKNLETFK